MRARWDAWAGLWARRESPRTLAIVRILVATVLLYDFWKVWDLGLVVPLWGAPDVGGLGDAMHRTPVPELYRWFPATAQVAWAAWGVVVGALACVLVGFATPVAALVATLTSAQLAEVLPLADRGIDLLLRDALFLLAFSGCNRAWAVDARAGMLEHRGWRQHVGVLWGNGPDLSQARQRRIRRDVAPRERGRQRESDKTLQASVEHRITSGPGSCCRLVNARPSGMGRLNIDPVHSWRVGGIDRFKP